MSVSDVTLTARERHELRMVDKRLRNDNGTAATIRVEAGDWTTVEHYVERIVAARVAEAEAKALEDAADELLAHCDMTAAQNVLAWQSASRVVRGMAKGAPTIRAAALRAEGSGDRG